MGIAIVSNTNSGLYQHMHAFQVQQLQSLHLGTPQSTSLQLQASRVTIATATVQPNCVHQGCSKAGNVNTTLTYPNCNLGRYRVRVPTQGRAFNCMLSGIVRVYRCTSTDELVRLCSFGSLVLWISLRSPSDLLYRLNCHVEK